MRELLRYGFILAFICAIASGLLSFVNSWTKPKIIAQAQAEEKSTLSELFPEAKNFEAVKTGAEVIYYKVYGKNNKLMGIVFKTLSKGYSSTIETMIGMRPTGAVSSIKILNHNETPGLGNKITEDVFTSKFVNKNIQGVNEVEAITGATISSQAVIDSVKNKLQEIMDLIKNEK